MALGRGTAGTCLLFSKGTVLPRASCKDGGRKLSQGYKGICRRPGQAGGTHTAAVWPDPVLVPLPGQPSAGTPSTRCWLPGRRRSPPPRGTSSQTGPVRPAQVTPCHGGMWAGGHAACWPLRPRAQLQLSHFFTVGGGKGHLSDSGPPSLPHHQTASSQAQAGTQHPWEPWPQHHGHPPCL